MTEQPEKSIAQPRFVRPHGAATRGLDLSPKSTLFQGRFGRIFRALPAADYGATDAESLDCLNELAAAMIMTSPPAAPADIDPVKDSPDDEESGIPALYTYFGQFIDHDLTFDPASSLQRQNDPDALIDFRTPAFDLDCVYGRGIDDQPYLYEFDGSFILGDELTGKAMSVDIAGAHHLPRSNPKRADASDAAMPLKPRAIIGDPRNDENAIVSQLQGLFHRFHNRLIQEEGLPFTEAQRVMRWCYQWVVVNDFLKRIVHKDVYRAILPHDGDAVNVVKNPPKLRFYHPHQEAFMPLEFAAAAYRFGHSMVRPGYRLNDDVIQPIFQYPGSNTPGPGLQGFTAIQSDWAIDWSRFIDIELREPGDDTQDGTSAGNQFRLQLAYRIDTSLTTPLADLHNRVVAGSDPIASLAARNLIRGWRMRLPSGQSVAKAIGVAPLEDDQLLLGKALDDEDPGMKKIGDVCPAFKGNCPLWVYVLAEAAQFGQPKSTFPVHTSTGDRLVSTPQLGPVGGTIVAETFAGILLKDPNSYWNLDPLWTPHFAFNGNTIKEKFSLREFVAYALGKASIVL